MRPEMYDLCVVTDSGRARLTYHDGAGQLHELASSPDTEKGKRWLEQIAHDIKKDLSNV